MIIAAVASAEAGSAKVRLRGGLSRPDSITPQPTMAFGEEWKPGLCDQGPWLPKHEPYT